MHNTKEMMEIVLLLQPKLLMDPVRQSSVRLLIQHLQQTLNAKTILICASQTDKDALL